MNESCRKQAWVTSHMWMSHDSVAYTNEACHTWRATWRRIACARQVWHDSWVMSHTRTCALQMRHVTHEEQRDIESRALVMCDMTHESSRVLSLVLYEWVMSHIKSAREWVMSHMTHESCHIHELLLYEWVMSHIKSAREWVMSHMTHESCHIHELVLYEWVMSHIKSAREWVMSHMTHESCHIHELVLYEWVMSRMKSASESMWHDSLHIWRAQGNESYHTRRAKLFMWHDS